MIYQGVLKKMKTENQELVRYYLGMDTDFIAMNQLIGKEIKLEHTGYSCMSCSLDKEIYRQGYCKSCFFETPLAGDWIMKPELSKAHLGIEDRDLVYEKKMQLQPHIVYLAVSSGVKVGVTRKAQLPTRWIDQGAIEAIVLLETPNRYLAGQAEVLLKEFVSDKTSWQKMLKSTIEPADLVAKKKELAAKLPEDLQKYIKEEDRVHSFHFPIENPPLKVKSLNLKKEGSFQGVLKGVKAQYLIFENDTVFNVRANEGFKVGLEILA